MQLLQDLGAILDLTGRKRRSHTDRQLEKGPCRESDGRCNKQQEPCEQRYCDWTGGAKWKFSARFWLSNSDLDVAVVLGEFLAPYYLLPFHG